MSENQFLEDDLTSSVSQESPGKTARTSVWYLVTCPGRRLRLSSSPVLSTTLGDPGHIVHLLCGSVIRKDKIANQQTHWFCTL